MGNQSVEAVRAIPLEHERRGSIDRRELTWRTLVVGAIRPRRRSNRRGDESEGLLDWHEPHLFFMALTILLLSVADALLTVTLIGRGAHEANPVMAYFIEEAPQVFALVKMALTGMGVVVLVALSRARVFRIVRISNIIQWCMFGYVLLIFYEAWLLRQTM